MRGRTIGVVIALLLVINTVIGCAAPADDVDQPIELTIATVVGERHNYTDMYKVFANGVTERTNGQVTFRFGYGATFGAATELLELVSSGAIDMAHLALGYYGGEFPLGQLTSLIMVSYHHTATRKAISHMLEEYPMFRGEFENQNTHLVMYFSGQVSPVGTNKWIQTLEDLRGMRIRTAGPITPALKAWGSVPVALTVHEVYEGLDRGILDGYTGQPMVSIAAHGLSEVTDYVVDIGIGSYTAGFMVMNADRYDSLPDHVKVAIAESAEEAVEAFAGITTALERDAIAQIIKTSEIYSFSPEEKARVRALALPAVSNAWLDRVSPVIGRELAEEILARYIELSQQYSAERDIPNAFELYELEFAP